MCNHTLTHPEQPFAHRSAEEIERQVGDTQTAKAGSDGPGGIANAAGVSPHRFRPPGWGLEPTS